jgi:hypothetical protein
MVTWSRLLGGGVRDALVGGHLLIGVAFGVGFATWAHMHRLLREQSGAFPTGTGVALDSILDARRMTAGLDAILTFSILSSLFLLLFFFLLRTILRRPWLAAAIFIIVFTFGLVSSNGSDQSSVVDWVISGLSAVVMAFILTRFGVLALIVAILVWNTLNYFPLTVDLSTWYAGSSLFAIVSVLALSGYALFIALAGRPLFKAEFLDSD